MADTCPNCGYCSTCKRAAPATQHVGYPLAGGYRCPACGLWAYGAHACWTAASNAYPWTPMYPATTANTFTVHTGGGRP